MGKYIIKRIVFAVITVYIVATATFFMMFMVPGGPFLAEKAPSQATLDALNEKYGLDQPKIVQYKNYMTRLLHGDLGTSLKQRGREVNYIISTKFPVSARLGIIAAVTALLVGIPLGSVAALKRGKWQDSLIMFFSTIGNAVPSFVVGSVLVVVFCVKIPIFPTFGLSTPLHYVLPVMALAFYPSAYIARLIRSSMLDVLGQDYMRTAKAKGLSWYVSLFKHALRNSILPVVTYLGPMIAYTLTGSLVIEKIFTIPGLGNEFVSSIISRDYPLIMGTTIFLAVLIISMNILVDIVYKIIDPRIKLN